MGSYLSYEKEQTEEADPITLKNRHVMLKQIRDSKIILKSQSKTNKKPKKNAYKKA